MTAPADLIFACPHCGKKNRVKDPTALATAKCAVCDKPLDRRIASAGHIVSCPRCSKKNRVKDEAHLKSALCAACGQRLVPRTGEVVACPHCGKKNRVAHRDALATAKCAGCHGVLAGGHVEPAPAPTPVKTDADGMTRLAAAALDAMDAHDEDTMEAIGHDASALKAGRENEAIEIRGAAQSIDDLLKEL